MRRYDDPVEVRKEDDRPAQFLWHGRLWKVREVLAHWVETGPWWQSSGVRAVLGTDTAATTPSPSPDARDLLVERELWRVEANRPLGPPGTAREDPNEASGIFDLAFSWTDGRWQLIRCAD